VLGASLAAQPAHDTISVNRIGSVSFPVINIKIYSCLPDRNFIAARTIQ
jgi:hypothetical protein